MMNTELTMPTTNSTDEFGRDSTLRLKNFMAELNRKYGGMSWSEICYAIEEEEEQEQERQQLLAKNCSYELEDGEIFE
jgi:hypothetical protein